MSIVKEGYNATRMAASAPLFSGSGVLSGALCTTAGTIAINDGDDNPIVSEITMVAGQYYIMPFALANGCNVVLGGGAVVTMAWA